MEKKVKIHCASSRDAVPSCYDSILAWRFVWVHDVIGLTLCPRNVIGQGAGETCAVELYLSPLICPPTHTYTIFELKMFLFFKLLHILKAFMNNFVIINVFVATRWSRQQSRHGHRLYTAVNQKRLFRTLTYSDWWQCSCSISMSRLLPWSARSIAKKTVGAHETSRGKNRNLPPPVLNPLCPKEVGYHFKYYNMNESVWKFPLSNRFRSQHW